MMATLLGLSLVAAWALQVTAQQDGGYPGRYVQLAVDGTGRASFLRSRETDHWVSPAQDHRRTAEGRDKHVHPVGGMSYEVRYSIEGETYHTRISPEHRYKVIEGAPKKKAGAFGTEVVDSDRDDPDVAERHVGRVIRQDVATVTLTLPREVEEIYLTPLSIDQHEWEHEDEPATTTQTVHIPSSEREVNSPFLDQSDHASHRGRSANVQAKQLDAKLNTIQKVGRTEDVKNLVFLSAGYTSGEKTKWEDLISQKLLGFMQGLYKESKHDPEPYKRYFGSMNIFTVFTADDQSGVTHPKPAGSGVQRVNTMDCAYGSQMERFLQCNDDKVKWVGSYAPPKADEAVYIVLVNDETYGGSGGGGVSVHSVLEKSVVGLFIHELGHADGGLMDEYDYGFNEPKALKGIPNCALDPKKLPWEDVKQKIDSSMGAYPICGFNNWVKPTNERCLMFSNSKQTAYCPVCHSAAVAAFYSKLKSVITPSCPLPGQALHHNPGDPTTEVEMWLNSKTAGQSQFAVTAKICPEQNLKSCKQIGSPSPKSEGFKITFNPKTLGLKANSLHTILVEVTDTYSKSAKQFVTSSELLLNYTSSAPMKAGLTMSTNTTGCKMTQCTSRPSSSGGVHPGSLPFYCGKCLPGIKCEMDFVAAPREAHGAGDALDNALQIIKALAISLGGGIGFFFMVFCLLGRCLRNRKRDIARQPMAVKYMRNVMMATGVILMLACLLFIAYCIFLWSTLDSFGRVYIFIGMGFAVFTFALAFIGFAATWFRSRVLMGVNGVLLAMFLIAACTLTVEVFHIGTSLSDNKWEKMMEKYWISFIADRPNDACSLQKALKCSGFTHGCHLTTAGSTYCPIDCEFQNRNVEGCYGWLKRKIAGNFETAGYSGVCGIVFFALSVLFNWCYCCTIRSKEWVEERMEHKVDKAKRKMTLRPDQQPAGYGGRGRGPPPGRGRGRARPGEPHGQEMDARLLDNAA